MPEIELISVNVGQPTVIGSVRGRPLTSAIGKQPVSSDSLYLDWLNLEGDRQADLSVHGGPDKAVYAYPAEHIRDWAAELAQELGPASFGENLTTEGMLEDGVCIGDVWAWGEALLQVSQPRQPCIKLATYRRRNDLPKRFVAKGWTGWYFRVLRPGQVPTAGPIEVIERDLAHLSVLAVHRARLFGQGAPDDLRRMASLPALTETWREAISQRCSSPTTLGEAR